MTEPVPVVPTDANLELIQSLILAVISVLTPTIIAGLKKLTSRIPSKLIPILAPIIGVVLTALGSWAGVPMPDTTAVVTVGAIGGLAGVGVREVVNQQMKPANPAVPSPS